MYHVCNVLTENQQQTNWPTDKKINNRIIIIIKSILILYESFLCPWLPCLLLCSYFLCCSFTQFLYPSSWKGARNLKSMLCKEIKRKQNLKTASPVKKIPCFSALHLWQMFSNCYRRHQLLLDLRHWDKNKVSLLFHFGLYFFVCLNLFSWASLLKYI